MVSEGLSLWGLVLVVERGLHQSLSQGEADDFRSVVKVQLVQDVADMELHGVFTDTKLFGQFSVGRSPLDHQF